MYFILNFKIKNGIVYIAASPKKKNCSNYKLFQSFAMRGVKVVFCRERNKYVKILIFMG